jgi:predicted phosphodiesterase
VKLGLVSDIHGNRVALEAVVADGRAAGVDRWWALGDLVAIGPDPVHTLELLVDLPRMAALRGNTERYLLTNEPPPPYAADVLAQPELLATYTEVQRSFAWTAGALAAPGWLDWLADLPTERRTVLPDGTRVLGVHATPGRDDGPGITPHRDEAELRRDLEGAEADLVVAGHTHQPTDRRVGPVRAVNLGSVGNPVTVDLRASYVMIHADRHGHRVEHRRVAYDRAAFLTGLARSGHPTVDYVASFQRGERARFPAGP